MQAKDIDTDWFLREIDRLSRTHSKFRAGGPDIPQQPNEARRRWVMTWDLEPVVDAPWKVVLAKCRGLIKRGYLDGCACGCRGDFELTQKGYDRIGSAKPFTMRGIPWAPWIGPTTERRAAKDTA